MTNVFKIRHGKETHVYRTDIAADKKNLLSQFRQVAEELAAKKRKEREGEHQRRKSMWIGGDVSEILYFRNDAECAFLPAAELGGPSRRRDPSYARVDGGTGEQVRHGWWREGEGRAGRKMDRGLHRRVNRGGSTERMGQSRSTCGGRYAAHDYISLRVKLNHNFRSGEAKLPVMPLLAAKLTPLKTSLIAALLQSLSMQSNRKSTVVSLITLLVRLKAGAAARNTFLIARAAVIKKCTRKITFDGHVGTYIGDLATVVFTGIKHTADWFLASFKENEVASSMCFCGHCLWHPCR